MTFLLQGPGVALRTTNDEGASASLTYYVTLQPGSTYSYGDAVNPSLPLEYFSTSGTVGSTQAGSTSSGTGTAVERSDAVEHGEPGRQLGSQDEGRRRAHPPPPRSSGATSRRRSARRAI